MLGDVSVPSRDARYPGGDDRLRRLLAEYKGQVTRYVSRLGVAASDVDDVAQESFLVAAAKIDAIPTDRERAFLFGIVSYVAQNARRAKARRNRVYGQLLDIESSPHPSQEDMMDELRTRVLVDSVLREMRPELRSILMLCEVEGLAVPEIAARLSLPTGTAASRLRRARKNFFERYSRAAVPRRPHPEGGATRGLAAAADGPEILSWWVNDGEVEALRALVDVYRRTHPTTTVNWSGIRDTQIAKASLRARMAAGAPPDTFQAQGGRDLFRWATPDIAGAARLESLEAVFEEEGWGAAFPQEILDLVTWEGEAYAVPLNIHRTNSLIFDSRALASVGEVAPESLDDLHRVVARLRRVGAEPLAIGAREPWVLSMLAFEQILVALAGPLFYRAFCEGKLAPRTPEVRAAIEELGRLLDACNADATAISWDQAADRVRIGRAPMTLMGDWTKGYLERRGCLEGESFEMAPSPGTHATFVFTMDVFGLPRGAPHHDAALDLLRVFGGEQGQSVFSRLKGSRPARQDLTPLHGDALDDDFRRSVHVPTMTSLVSATFSSALDAAMAAYAVNRDVSAVLATIERQYDGIH